MGYSSIGSGGARRFAGALVPTLPQYTVISGTPTIAGSGAALSCAQQCVIRTDGFVPTDAVHRVRLRTGAVPNLDAGLLLRGRDSAAWLMAHMFCGTTGTPATLALQRRSGSFTLLASNSALPTVTAATDYWLEVRASSAGIHVAWYGADPAALPTPAPLAAIARAPQVGAGGETVHQIVDGSFGGLRVGVCDAAAEVVEHEILWRP